MSMQNRSDIDIKFSKDSPTISYLMFGDNYIIFSWTTKKAVRKVNDILDHYFQISGQLVNYQKSRV